MDAEVGTAGSGPSKRTRPKTADELILRGDRARDARDWAAARSSYERALQLDPTLAPIWIQLGHASKQASDYAAAEQAYRKALELNPYDADGKLQLGHLLKTVDRLDEARVCYTEALAIDPDLIDARLALEAADPLARKRAETADLIKRADGARHAGDWQSARSSYERALQLDPTLAPIWIQLGHASKQASDYAAAEQAYRKALELNPYDADGKLQLGHLLKTVDRLDEARVCYTEALAIDPDLIDARLALEAADPADKKAEIAELRRKGDQARNSRDWHTARTCYEQALQLDPTLAGMWIQLGHSAKESRDFAAAENAYRKALELNRKDADAHLQLGHLMKITKRVAEASVFYTEAMALDPKLLDARREIKALRAQIPTAVSSSAFAKMGPTPPGLISLVFEVSDLMTYFQTSRLPTGIQRVQMEVIHALDDDESSALDCAIVCFVQERGFWVEVPRSLFNRFCLAAIASGDPSAEDWDLLLESLTVIRTTAPLFAFPQGSILLDLGTSWWQRNYFLNLRVAKAASHISYVPFIHDLIPIITPEHCAAELRRDFLTWIAGVFHHADHFFVNSDATRKDLQMVAKELGRSPGEIAVVTLAADFRRPVDSQASVGAVEDAKDLLASYGLAKGNYVLCVATIESRKNHAAAFAVWLRMIKKYGTRNVPKLVCVGKDGWLNDSVYHTLSASELLSNQVMILQNISDASLGALYANCLFTLYPSFYEGWGLPVTEALCYGKVPVTTKASSLPQAGGEFAEYFEIGSENEFLAKVERLTFDSEYRTAREQQIANEFKPRSWGDISAQIVGQLQQWAEAAGNEPTAAASPAEASLGFLHSLARGTDAILWKGLESGEIYRQGRAWWFTEDWGCWTTGKHPAFLTFTLKEAAEAEVLLYLALRGTPGSESVCTVRSEGVAPIEVDLAPDQDQIVVLELPATPETLRQVTVSLSSGAGVDLSGITEGMDNRIVGPGVRWFYACKKDDVLARVSMAEALAMGDFRRLIRRPPHGTDYFIHT